jgi:protein phosphatase 2C family protein 2/3
VSRTFGDIEAKR